MCWRDPSARSFKFQTWSTYNLKLVDFSIQARKMSNTQLQPVSTQQMQLCFRTKKEMHTFLTESGRAYLPKVAAVKIEFMKQVMLG
jgi:hypothetical protein